MKWLSWVAAATACAIIVPLVMAKKTPEDRWQGFYSKATLEQTAARSTPDIRAILVDDIPKILTAEQRTRLSGVSIEFPLESPEHIANFFSDPKSKQVVMPVSSIRFLRDIAVAYAWLNVKGYDIQPVSDYLALIKYQWPDSLQNTAHTPLETLGIPANALDETAVAERFQSLFGSMIVFILGHELGHIYHQHPGYDATSLSQSKRLEQDADAFALGIMQQMGEAPTGASFYFFVLAHLEPFVGDSDFNQHQANRTHPLNPPRIAAIAGNIKQNAARFAAGSTNRKQTLAALTTVSDELGNMSCPPPLSTKERHTVSCLLGDEGVQAALRKIGLSTRVDMLQPRRVGELAKLPGEDSAVAAIFSGIFVGEWIDEKAVGLNTKMVLTRNGDTVTGTYTVGLGAVTLEGKVQGNDLEYTWRWGDDYFGQGKLSSQQQGKTLTGTWGYTKATTGGGTWQLTQQ